MDKIVAFKVCDLSRTSRYIIPALPTMTSLIEQASNTYQRNFAKIVLEADGCQISNDVVLTLFTGSLLMLLTPDEDWSRESFILDNNREMDSKGNLFSVNQSNIIEQSAVTVVDDQPQPSFLHQLQLTPNVLAVVTDPDPLPSISIQPTPVVDNPDEDLPSSEPSEANDDSMDNTSNDENKSPNTPIKRGRKDHPELHIVKKHVSNEMKFRSFQIKWDKISDKTLSKLDNLQDFTLQHPSDSIPKTMRLTKQERCGLVNCIVDQLRVIDTFIRADTMETVAKDILRKYPCLEMVDDDGYGDGLSYVVLKHKLINHNSYLNRFKDPNSQNTIPITQARKSNNARAGTTKEYWAKSSSECARELFVKLRRDEPALLTDECLQSSQAYVRHRLDSHRDLGTLLLELPVLRRRKLLYYHFKQATGIEIDYVAENSSP
nr:uncharacterized protein LOC109432100 isoform X2 [Aedes albopictus]